MSESVEQKSIERAYLWFDQMYGWQVTSEKPERHHEVWIHESELAQAKEVIKELVEAFYSGGDSENGHAIAKAEQFLREGK